MTSVLSNSYMLKRASWIFVLAVASIVFSFAFTCAMPFAALAAIGALRLRARDAYALVGLCWLLNQIVGYGFLGYPTTWDSFAWGGVLGVSIIAATAAVIAMGQVTRNLTGLAATSAAFITAFAVQQLTVFSATMVLPSGDAAFSASVVSMIFATNALAFGFFYFLQIVGERTGMVVPRVAQTASVG